jgi:hypothetical protein
MREDEEMKTCHVLSRPSMNRRLAGRFVIGALLFGVFDSGPQSDVAARRVSRVESYEATL